MSRWARVGAATALVWARVGAATALVWAAWLAAPAAAVAQAAVVGVEAAAQQNLNWIAQVVTHVTERLAAHAPAEHRKQLNAAEVIVGPKGDYFSAYDPSTGKITIQYGTWSLIGRVADMLLDVRDDPRQAAKITPYIEYLATIRADVTEVVLRRGAKRFAEFVGFGGADWNGPPGNTSRGADYYALYLDTTAFLLAHEFHHKLAGHKSPAELTPTDARRQELEADMAAIDWALNAEFSAAGVYVYLLIPTALQVDVASRQLVFTRSHMHPVCRQGLGTLVGLIDLLADATKHPSPVARKAELSRDIEHVDALIRRESGSSLDAFLRAMLDTCDASVVPLIRRLQTQIEEAVSAAPQKGR